MFTREELINRKIVVLLGGKSAEREISFKTGKAMLGALKDRGYDALPLDVGDDVAQRLAELKPAAAVNALHGRWGEDGAIQGLLECMGIPYTGSGLVGSAVAMDKVASKRVFAAVGLPTPEYVVVPREDVARFTSSDVPFGLPMVVKPSREGSSVGVTIVREEGELPGALAEAARFAGDVMVERYVKGREVAVALLDGEALGAIEIRPKRAFYDYEAKYGQGSGTEYVFPAPLTEAFAEEVSRVGLAAHRTLGCSGVTRADFIVTDDAAFLIELNTLPGMTETSLVPKIAAGRGISFGELCERLLLGASLKV